MYRQTPAAGWYPDPNGSAAWRYWDGSRWTDYRSTGSSFRHQPPAPAKPTPWEKIVGFLLAIVFAALAVAFAAAAEWDALLGLAVVTVLVGAALLFLSMVIRRLQVIHVNRAEQARYEAGLVARFDEAAKQWSNVGDPSASGMSPRSGHLPDADEMRQQAWQPDVGSSSMPAVRPTNPAPWHIVTQFPTQQFRSHHEPNGGPEE